MSPSPLATYALQKKLDALATLANEIEARAKILYGEQAFLFFEAGGMFHVMTGDCGGTPDERQKYIAMTSTIYCGMGAGAW